MNYVVEKASGDISLRLNQQENDVSIEYPQTYNISATTLYGSITIYKDGVEATEINGLDITPTRNTALYNITAVSSGDQNHSSASITRWINVTLDTVSPSLELISPQEGSAYGYNTNIPLKFSVSDQHLESCWYNINNEENKTIVNCQNTTFNITSDGSHTLYLFANDSLGNLNEKNATFSVLVGAPTITLSSPIRIYSNTESITFSYTPSDLDLETCELWGNFTGLFAPNQTSVNPISGTENFFFLNLADGSYKWNVRCNDSQGHYAFNGNKTFYIDTKKPIITISEPAGTKTSWTNVPLAFNINDSSPVSCKYNVYWATGINVISNTSIPSCTSETLTALNLSSVGDYILNLYVTDFAGNSNSSSSSFTISTSQTQTTTSGGDGGGQWRGKFF